MNIISGLVNIIRMLSLTKSIIFIETIDEKIICDTIKVITVIVGVMTCIAKVFSGDVFNGTTYNFVTRSKVQEGTINCIIIIKRKKGGIKYF